MSTDGTAGIEQAPVAEPVVAPAPEAPPVAPVAAEPATPPDPAATPEAPAAEPAAPETPAPEEPKPEAEPAEPGSLVEQAPEVKPEDAKPEGELEPPAPEPITYEAFTYPEGVTVDEAELAPFTELLSANGASQEFGQALIDQHTAQLQAFAERVQQGQVDAFAKTREGWRSEFEAGAGNRRDTILADAKSAITAGVPDEADRKALWDVLSYTGAGDNPRVINAFAALGAKLRERSAPPPSLPTNPARSGRPEDRRYGAASPR